ncbi:MAG TPA: hypothetical protein VFH66_08970 [Mycobacteriales bacterium]|nr:hypothetical protein [Mycobacteriales bacterium]
MTTPIDPRVEAYLRQLNFALSPLPWDQRNEIFTDISDHIARELTAVGGEPTAVDDVLRRVGDPHAIAQEAGAPPLPMPVPPRTGRGLEIAAVLLISAGSIFVPLLGWLVGVVLLWVSRRFTRADKLIGTLLPPFGFFAPFVLAFMPLSSGSSTACVTPLQVGSAQPAGNGGATAVGLPAAHCTTVTHGIGAGTGLAILLVLVVAAIYTVVRLSRRVAHMT